MAASALAWHFVIPAFGWRVLFAVAGAGALLVWWAHKNMLESPRWLESVGRFDEAGRMMAEIEAEIRKALPGPASGTRETSTVPVELRVLWFPQLVGVVDDKYSQ